MKTRLLLIAVLISGNIIYAQQNDCKVLLQAISGTYTGGCKNGLAHGKGKAQGIDSYEGQFIKGLPTGNGTYTWKDGSYYEGQWKNGIREGKGKMVIRDSVTSGYWKKDKYMGPELIPPYKITHNMNMGRYNIKKTINTGQEIKIRIMQGGMDNVDIEAFSLAYSSGDEYRSANIYAIQHVKFPINVKITYSTWNQLHQSKYNVSFEFTINDPGSWDVTLYN
jgi:hypothetical protein